MSLRQVRVVTSGVDDDATHDDATSPSNNNTCVDDRATVSSDTQSQSPSQIHLTAVDQDVSTRTHTYTLMLY